MKRILLLKRHAIKKWAWIAKFPTAEAAPMVTPYVREAGISATVNDNFSVVSGWLTGANVAGDKKFVITSPAVVRADQKIFGAKLKASIDGNYRSVGLATSSNPVLSAYAGMAIAFLSFGTILYPVSNAIRGPVIGAIVQDGTEYILLPVPLPAGGGIFFIKGGAYTNFTRVWEVGTGTTGTLYGFCSNNTALIEVDFIGQSIAAFVDIELLRDSFGGTWPVPDGIGGSWRDSGSWSSAGGVALNTPALGLELWDADAAAFASVGNTYAWTAAGTNTIGNPANALVITYNSVGGSGNGAVCNLNDAADLFANLTVGRFYDLEVDFSINTGSARIMVATPTITVASPFLSNTTPVRQYLTFKADHATNAYSNFDSMGAGEVITIDNLSLKPIPKSQLFAGMELSTNDIFIEQILHARLTGTQQGMIFNCDRSFAAKCAATAAAGQAVIALKEVTGVGGVGLSTSDMITVGGVQYNIASTTGGANVAYDDTAKTQTVTLAANLGAQVNADDKVGLDWAVFNAGLLYFDGTGKLRLDQVKAGVYTTIGTPPATTFVADYRLLLNKIGSAYRWYYGAPGAEVLIGSSSTIDAAVMPGRYHGMFSTRPENTTTAFKVNPTGSGANEYGPQLDRYATE